MTNRVSVWLIATSSYLATANGFNLYPLLPADVMQSMLGITPQCLDALNTTLSCDSSLFQWTLNVDSLHWQEPDLTALCTPDCTDGASRWKAAVEESCQNQWLRSGDRYVPADTISGRFTDGLSIVCTQSSRNEWCLLESYDWVGSDVVQVDCDTSPADPWCINKANPSPNNSRISTLYDDDLLCSECFTKMLRQRVTSDFLPNTDFSDYLANELQDIEKVCSMTTEDITTRAVPWYPELSDGAEIGITTTSATTTAQPTPTACAGRMIDIRPDLEEELSCHDIAEKYRVGSGEVAMATRNEYCEATEPICLPNECSLHYVVANQTCLEVTASMSELNSANITVAQLATWNPNLLGVCDGLLSQLVCKSPPGGAWAKPPDSEIPDNSEGPVRGGPGSTPSLPITDNPDDVPADKVQDGVPEDCTKWIYANSTAASCWKMANDAKISVLRLCELNPVLGKNGQNCGTQVWLNYYYCVASRSGGDDGETSTTITASSTTTSAGPVKPTQTQSGISKDCNKFEEAQASDSCWAIANRTSIELSSLYAWNAALGSNGENCGTQIWPGYFYCVGVSSSEPPTTTATAGPALPTQTQDGFPKDCQKYVAAGAGNSCWTLAMDNGLTLEELYRLNPVLGSEGENCGTQIWPGYYYCLAR